MILSFKHKGLKRFFEQDDRSGIRPDLVGRVEMILAALDDAGKAEQMNLPTFRFHALTGDLKGYYSVVVRANWRIIFRFESGHAFDVELIDYGLVA